MADQSNRVNGNRVQRETPDYDALVVGAGFAGLRLIFELRKLGSTFKVLEEGSGLGGTWFWNRYPGARTDSESWIYILNVSEELNNDWSWKERYPRQDEVLEYLNHVADRFDLRKDIQFNTRIKSAIWDDQNHFWRLKTATGDSYTCRYFIPATGALSVGMDLPFPGVDVFEGESYVTSAWPEQAVDLKGKRVGIVGTGATGVQLVPTVAHSAASVTVFQRTANYVVPGRNYPLTSAQQDEIKRNYTEIWEGARAQSFGMAVQDSKVSAHDLKTDLAIQRVLEHGWELGGLQFLFECFNDVVISKETNEIVSEFVKAKIRAIVKDPETAEMLCPDHPIMAKRVPLGHHYFETFNKSRVTLLDIRNNSIKDVTKTGILLSEPDRRTGKDMYELDVIIYALGFDVSTGPLTRLEVRGREDRTLGDHWKESLETYLGIMVEKYPNMFMMAGPQIPFANFPVVLDNTARWISRCLARMLETGHDVAEPRREAMDRWGKLLTTIFEMTILAEASKTAGSWFVGANVPGKPVRPLFWFGGVPAYFQECNAEAESGFPSLQLW